jgi:uncharacterized protein
MILRDQYLQIIQKQFKVHKVCALLGPRQSGKTTLAHQYIATQQASMTFFDLEDPTDLAKLENPKLVLEELDGLIIIIIDEIQRRPDLFPSLRVLVDRYPHRRYLILGSASRDLINQSSETLAGRVGYVEVMPLSLREAHDLPTLWQRGGYPLSFLAETLEESRLWRRSYITTFIERDLTTFFGPLNLDIRRLWTMLGHYHGGPLTISEIARSFGISDHTIRRYVDMLVQTFMVRYLKPWFANVKKRQVKTPKVYVRDSGLLHSLLNIDEASLSFHPKVGASWEGFALEQIIQAHRVDAEDCYFWSTSNKAELDLLIVQGDQKMGFDFKYTDSPRATKSMYAALENLGLDQLTVIFPIEQNFLIHENIRAIGLKSYLETVQS